MERLQKVMAHAGVASRRECEKLIEQGRVKVNGRVAKLGTKVDPSQDSIEVNGRVITAAQPEFVYIAMNKPKGVISSLEDELNRGRKTVRDMIPLPGHLYPVGRLDKQSEGLILMTNDGDLAHKLTHPRYGHKKRYHVVLEGMISDQSVQKWARGGMPLDGRMTIPAEIEVIRRQKTFTQLKVTLQEGRKRQIRRIANMLGHGVKELVREQIGPISLGNLASGQWRHLRDDEVKALRESVKEKGAKKRRPPKKTFYRPKGLKKPQQPEERKPRRGKRGKQSRR
ncbi:MAG: pseudouridine synthase [Chloroflexota bacterium]